MSASSGDRARARGGGQWTLRAVLCVAAGLPVPVLAGDDTGGGPPPVPSDTLAVLEPVGFLDGDLDGVNDRFADRDGNGVSDLTGVAYRHHFGWRDADGDGINDLYVDADGDGENDLYHELRAGPDSLRAQARLDADGDGVNDVLGPCPVTGSELGMIDESTGRAVPFLDDDGDGLNDHLLGRRMIPGTLRFIDRDGDGVQDGRALHHRHRGGGRGAGGRGRHGRSD